MDLFFNGENGDIFYVLTSQEIIPFVSFQVAYRVFQNHGFFHKFKIPQEIFFRYFRMLESGYHDIPCKFVNLRLFFVFFYLANYRSRPFSYSERNQK